MVCMFNIKFRVSTIICFGVMLATATHTWTQMHRFAAIYEKYAFREKLLIHQNLHFEKLT